MRWEDEPFVKIYTRDTPEFLALSWQARCLLHELVRKVDHAGILKVGRLGLPGVALVLRAPYEEIEAPLRELIDDHRVEVRTDLGLLIIPNHVAAQTACQSDTARKQRSRQAARDRAITLPDVTDGHARSRAVTDGHAESHAVTSRREEKRIEEREPRAHADETSPAEDVPSEADSTSRLRAPVRPGDVASSPPEDVPITEEIRAQCTFAGWPQPTRAHVVAMLSHARKTNKRSYDWPAELVSWMGKPFDRGQASQQTRDPPRAPYHSDVRALLERREKDREAAVLPPPDLVARLVSP